MKIGRAAVIKTGRAAVLVAAVAFVQACGGGGAPPPPPPAPGPVATPPRPAAAPKPAGGVKEPEPGPPIAPIPYGAGQQRDPFVTVVLPTERRAGLQVGSVRLVGVIQGRSQSLALVEAPDGIGYVLKSGDTLGDGRVTEIGANSVSFQVTARPGEKPTAVTLRLKTD